MPPPTLPCALGLGGGGGGAPAHLGLVPSHTWPTQPSWAGGPVGERCRKLKFFLRFHQDPSMSSSKQRVMGERSGGNGAWSNNGAFGGRGESTLGKKTPLYSGGNNSTVTPQTATHRAVLPLCWGTLQKIKKFPTVSPRSIYEFI